MKWSFMTRHCLRLQLYYISCGLRHASWSSQAARSMFINYFKNHGHEFVPSSSVISQKGEGTYFINAGMNQFKPLFLGELDSTSKLHKLTRATNSQKCIRVGGKHNDLNDVGHDLTHHTFFEMLGSWSFGDYFKTEACSMAHELLTREYSIPLDRLYFTYFGGDKSLNLPKDEDCKEIWLSLGIPEDRILPFGTKDNFWEMGLTGPCGPCTEIHYDHIGGRYAGLEVNSGSPNVVEIWNLVFMQYNRQNDQSLNPLPTFHVDTGMGLERITAVLNGSSDNYSTDLFLSLFRYIEKVSKSPPYTGNAAGVNVGYRMLADHARMFTIAVGDGLLPAYDDVGHKLRTIIYRCIHICREVFHVQADIVLPGLVPLVIESLGSVYPHLANSEQKICHVVRAAIDHYNRHRELSIKSFNKMMSKLNNIKMLSGEVILALEKGFYGTPLSLEMITEQAKCHCLSLELDVYEKLREERQAQVSTAPLTVAAKIANPLVNDMIAQHIPLTEDDFKYHYHLCDDAVYDFTLMAQETSPCYIQGMSYQGHIVDRLQEGDQGEIILNNTCFYAESGGQEADEGELMTETGEFQVFDVQYLRGYIIHHGQVTKGSLECGQTVELRICLMKRIGCMHNHTATHLLNSTLTEVFPTTQQQGSSITPYKFTFDILALIPLETRHVQQVELNVRKSIKQEFEVIRRVMPLSEALQLKEIKTLQNVDYPSEVSVITIGSPDNSLLVSRELCGGTHVWNTSHLREFCITHLTTKSQNVCRMTCVTGQEAEQAHLNGMLMQAVCVLLQCLVKSIEITNLERQNLIQMVHQVLTFSEQNKETLKHSFLPPKTGHEIKESWLKELLKENSKTKTWCESLRGCLDLLIGEAESPENLMKQLILQIRKGTQLELLPKSVRDEAHKSVEQLEHKVSEAANKKGRILLKKLIEDEIACVPDCFFLIIPVDTIDMDNRQLAKSLAQQSWDRILILVQKCNKRVSVLVSLPLSGSFQLLSKEELNRLVQHLGATKGKLASQNNKVAIYSFTVQGSYDSDKVLKAFSQVFDR